MVVKKAYKVMFKEEGKKRKENYFGKTFASKKAQK